MKVRCHITAKDIREATCILAAHPALLTTENCPAARAVNRKLRDGYFSAASRTHVRIYFHDTWKETIPLSENMTRWIHTYDMSRRITEPSERARPTNFTIDIPSMYVRNEETE
jgi:hypothetical protein